MRLELGHHITVDFAESFFENVHLAFDFIALVLLPHYIVIDVLSLASYFLQIFDELSVVVLKSCSLSQLSLTCDAISFHFFKF